jgi:hypothetical protein
MSGSQPSMRTLALWLIPLGGLAAYGAYLTDFGRNLDADDVRWRKVTSSTAPSGVVPDIAFNADASPYAAVTDRNLFVPWRKPSRCLCAHWHDASWRRIFRDRERNRDEPNQADSGR